jgi:hypothetical protein
MIWFQFAVSVLGAWAFDRLTADEPMTGQAWLLGVMFVGVAAAWLATFLMAWVRYGLVAARSLRWGP